MMGVRCERVSDSGIGPPIGALGGWLAVFVCYLDDSGKDKQNRITTVAGFVAREEAWAEFERRVEPLFSEYAVPVLHAMRLQNTDDPFGGWTVLRKQAFVAKICGAMKSLISLGLSMSATKDTYKSRAIER